MLKGNPQDSPLLGGRYQVIRRLAAGGFGQTFLAQDQHLPGHPICVIKQLQPRFTDERSLKTARRLFDTEAEVLYTLGNHPQIPRLMAHFEENQEFYLAQEYVDGDPLDSRLVPGHPWEPVRVVALLEDILQVLTFVHEQNVIHRDIKPANLLYRKDDRIVLIDFGAVKQVNTALADPERGTTNLTVSVGTQGYMPSEQLSGQPRFSSDIYAVGMVAIQALTGVRPQSLPMDPDTGEVDWEQVQASAPAALDPALVAVLQRMVYYDFRSRYASAAAAIAALQNLPEPLRQAVPDTWQAPPSPPPSPPRPRPSSKPTEVVVGRQSAVPETVPSSGLAPTTLSSTARWRWVTGALGAIALMGGGLLLRTLWPTAPATTDVGQPVETATPQVVSEAASESANEQANGRANGQAEENPASAPGPDPAVQALQQGNALREQASYPEAIAQYDQAIAADAEAVAAYWGKCYSLNRLNQPQAAIAACDQALALDPDNPDALSSKGYALQLQDQQQAALALFNRALAQDPGNADILINQGSALLAIGQPQAAVAAFDRAIATRADSPEAWNNRGAALWDLRQFEEALSSVEQAIALDPDYKEAKALRKEMRKRL